jgi:hypothetical protein
LGLSNAPHELNPSWGTFDHKRASAVLLRLQTGLVPFLLARLEWQGGAAQAGKNTVVCEFGVGESSGQGAVSCP